MPEQRTQYHFLKPEDVLKLRSYEFAPKMIVDGYFAGTHRSSHKGQSADFFDYREYSPGDDIRSIDWKVFARSDRYFVRLFEQYTDMVCYLFLDSSGSMGYGKPFTKLEYCSFFAAALSYLVIKQGDLVSVTVTDDGIREHFPAGSTHGHLTNILNCLERNRPGRRTNLAQVLLRATPLLKKRGILIIISDLLDSPGRFFTALNPYLHRGFEVMIFHILHPEELKMPPRGYVRFEDMETGRHLTTDSDTILKGYVRAVEQARLNVRALSIRKGVTYTFANTQTHYFNLFDEFTAKRGRSTAARLNGIR